MELLEIQDLTFSYFVEEPGEQTSKGIPLKKESGKKVLALRNLNLSIKQGEFLLLCGESGCGKTTLLRMLKRELAPFGEKQGRIFYKGILQEELDERTSACRIGYVMQNPEHQIVTDKVWHELAFGLENMGLPTREIRRKVGEMANFFGIAPWFRDSTHALSGGQKQMLNLASIVAMEPELLILDEPTSQLDPIAASEFIHTLVKLNRELGTTILLTEHRLEEVFPAADRVGIMEEGRMLMTGAPREVGKRLRQQRPGHKMLLGLPSAMRIYQGVETSEDLECPLTVRDGRNFLMEHYGNRLKRLPREEGVSRKQETAIWMKDVWFRYEREAPDVLEQVSLEVKEGEILSILGGNGSGKTTLLSVLSGANRAYKGKIRIFGKRMTQYRGPELYRGLLALLPQNPQTVFCAETLRQDYEEVRKVMGVTEEAFSAQVEEVTERLGISQLLLRHPYDLSGGEQQKAALGKLLLRKPKILLLDEPTKGIDAYGKQKLLEILSDLRKRGMTILTVTHDVEFAALASDRCAMFFDRGITCVETPTEFFKGNRFYTTGASRICRGWYEDAITCQDVIELCRQNGRSDA